MASWASWSWQDSSCDNMQVESGSVAVEVSSFLPRALCARYQQEWLLQPPHRHPPTPPPCPVEMSTAHSGSRDLEERLKTSAMPSTSPGTPAWTKRKAGGVSNDHLGPGGARRSRTVLCREVTWSPATHLERTTGCTRR